MPVACSSHGTLWRPRRRCEDGIKIKWFFLLEYNVVYLFKVYWRFGGTCYFHLQACSPKRRLTFNGLHGDMAQKLELFITIAERTSYPVVLQLIVESSA
jgi:hypothetical protein